LGNKEYEIGLLSAEGCYVVLELGQVHCISNLGRSTIIFYEIVVERVPTEGDREAVVAGGKVFEGDRRIRVADEIKAGAGVAGVDRGNLKHL
jgi:hypothetical protein